MNEQLTQLLENYKYGIPIRIDRSSVITLAVAELVVIALGAAIVTLARKL